MRRLALADAELAIRTWGEEASPTLLYWPGLNPSAHAQLDELAGRVWSEEYGFRVLAVSPPGWETPPLPADGYRATRLADLAVATFDALDVAHGSFVGFSWGASIGCHVAARNAERLTALVLLDAGYLSFQDAPGFEERTLDAVVADMRSQSRPFASWDDALAAIRSRVRAWRPGLEARARAGLRETPDGIVPRVEPETAAAALHGVIADPPSDSFDALGQIDVPILLVVASETVAEEWARNALARFRSAVPKALVRELDSGHDLLADRPDETVQIVGDWLRSTVSGRN